MSELDIVRELAKQTLRVPVSTGNIDNFLWDRARRLVRNVEYICLVPELAKAEGAIDRFCLTAAAYFSDAGLIRHPEAGEAARSAPWGDNGDDLLDFCVRIVEEKLSPVIDEGRIGRINGIITESSNRFARSVEAMILSDARNLDDIGATGIFNELRRYVIGGKGVSDAVQIWKGKIDYRYWQARLKEGFRFESVRKLAERRLSAAEEFMNQLKREDAAGDLEELSSK